MSQFLGGRSLVLLFNERIGDVFQENQIKDDVLVLSGIYLRSEFVSCFPERLFEIVCHCILLAIHLSMF